MESKAYSRKFAFLDKNTIENKTEKTGKENSKSPNPPKMPNTNDKLSMITIQAKRKTRLHNAIEFMNNKSICTFNHFHSSGNRMRGNSSDLTKKDIPTYLCKNFSLLNLLLGPIGCRPNTTRETKIRFKNQNNNSLNNQNQIESKLNIKDQKIQNRYSNKKNSIYDLKNNKTRMMKNELISTFDTSSPNQNIVSEPNPGKYNIYINNNAMPSKKLICSNNRKKEIKSNLKLNEIPEIFHKQRNGFLGKKISNNSYCSHFFTIRNEIQKLNINSKFEIKIPTVYRQWEIYSRNLLNSKGKLNQRLSKTMQIDDPENANKKRNLNQICLKINIPKNYIPSNQSSRVNTPQIVKHNYLSLFHPPSQYETTIQFTKKNKSNENEIFAGSFKKRIQEMPLNILKNLNELDYTN